MSKERKLLIQIIYTAIFIALCYAGTFISIPLGTSKVHLGNFFCILAGLLCGGFIGGIAGSLGMGLNDLTLGYGWTTCVRTFLLKFLMGFLVGYLFRLCLKKKMNGTLLLGIATLICLGLFGYTLAMYFQPESEYGLVTLISTSVLAGLMLVALIVSFRLPQVSKCLLFALVIALTVNVAGEFFLRIGLMMVTGMGFDQALSMSIVKLPAAIFTSIITIAGIMVFYYPLYLATRKINQINDLEDDIPLPKRMREDEESKENEKPTE